MNQKILTLFIICIFSPCLSANDLNYFINLSLENHPSLLIKKGELEQSESTLKMNYSNMLPSLNIKLSDLKKTNNSLDSDQTDANLNMNLNLYNGGEDIENISISKIKINRTKEEIRRETADITYKVKQEYFKSLYAIELENLLSSIVQRRKQQLDFINMRFEGGHEDKGNYLQAKVKFRQATLEVTQSKRLLKTSLANLATNIGLSQSDIHSPSGSLEDYSNRYKNYSETDFQNSLKKVPEVLIAKYDIEIAKKSTNIANSSFRPSLDLNGSIGRSGTQFNELDNKSTSVGLTLTIPLFDGGRDTYNSKIARLEELNKEYWLKKEEQSLTASVTETKNLFLNSYENVMLQKELLDASKVRAKVATGKYTAGLMDYTTWDLIQTELISNEKSMLDAYKNALLQKTELDKILGIGVTNE